MLVVLGAMIVAAAAYLVFALNSGPVSVGFLKDTVRERVSDSIPGIRLDLDDVVVEQGEGNSHPNLRMTNVRLTDTQGNLIARAPRAAISVDIGEILSGTVKPKRLELIGARILARRKADGSIAMGFTDPVAASGKSDAGLGSQPGDNQDDRTGGGSAGSMMDTIARVLQGGEGGAAASLDTIEVTNAQISFKDEIQDHLWLSPRANLRFKKADGGFALFVDADISADGPTWRTELLTTFRKDANVYRVIAKVYDVTPADLARKLFSFNQLASINLPLSGEMQFDIDNKGTVLNAGGVLAIQAGKVSFPDYIADPLLIDEGLARFSFEPETGHVVITDSSLMIRGSEARFSGRLAPVRNEQDKIVSARIELDARNLNINTPGAPSGEANAIDEFKLRGEAVFDERRFVVDDLIVLSGKGGVRVRGQFVGEGDAVGVYVAGRGRALGHELIRKLWPPVMAAQSRQWYRTSVTAGTVDDAEFRVRLSGPQITAALDGKPLPPDAVDLKFTASGVEFLYADGLPKVTAGKGAFNLSGTVFDIQFDAATIPLPSGNKLAITGGNMQITQLALPVSPASMSIRLDGDVAAYHEYADLPALKLVEGSNFDVNKVTGRGLVTLNLAMPLKPGITSTDFTVSATAKLTGGIIREAVEGLDLADAELDLKLEDAVISANGTAQLGEKRAKISWRRPLSKSGNADEALTISATLSDRDRQKLGISLDPWMVGPIPVDVSMVRRGEQIASATVEADLSKVRMALDALSWSRPPTAKTKATFKVNMSDAKTIVIDDLEVTGKDLKIVGKVRVKRDGGLIDASLPRFILSDTNQLALEVYNSSGQLRMGVGGASLDARPLISQMMSSTVAAGSEASRNPPVAINTNISRIIVHRGELVNNLRGSLTLQGGAVQAAELTGIYMSGAPVTMRIQREGGNRRMRVTGRDAGATLRAVNLYSKILGGTIDFGAILGNPGEGAIKRGMLEVRNFSVQNETAIGEIDRTTRDAGRGTGGPRNNALRLSRMSVPFSVDHQFVRIGDALVQGPEIGASAQGIIRKADLAMDIGGTIIPAYALNSAISNVPVIGDVLTGGKGQGVFGLNFALQGSMNQPRFLVNPVSAIAPGIFRNLFNIGGGQTNADGTARAPGSGQARDNGAQTDR
ncbi:MAG: AsmA-like C-terminal domain-containing protein [Anderseniella sp.]|jgi:hypothetical protein|nr:AsmA-like C-terminal domain-containing protein [Anderseniella sp.]